VRTGQNEFDLAIQLRTYDVQVDDGDVRVRL
jgi:nitrite reductase/ring-hydroxylating ferredoxin subunit